MEPDESALRQELVNACKVLYRCGVADLASHISTRLDAERILVKPRRVNWLHARPEDLAIIDLQGQRLGAPPDEKRPLQEWPIHSAIYQARPDFGVVLHAHPTDSTLIATLGLDLQPLTRELAQIRDNIAVHHDPRDQNSLIDRFEEGAALAKMLVEPNTVLLLKSHGCVVAGADLAEVVVTAYSLERAAQALLKAAGARSADYTTRLDAEREEQAANNRPPEVVRQLNQERWAMLKGYFLDP